MNSSLILDEKKRGKDFRLVFSDFFAFSKGFRALKDNCFLDRSHGKVVRNILIAQTLLELKLFVKTEMSQALSLSRQSIFLSIYKYLNI